MKILILNTYDNLGGAARGAFLIHVGLLKKGYDSKMFVRKKITDYSGVISNNNFISQLKNKLFNKVEFFFLSKYEHKSKTKFSTSFFSTTNIAKKINRINPDIVHIQWVADNMLTYKDISKIKAPILWTLRDMMPFTGGCHYNEGCEKFKQTCQTCHVLSSKKKRDLSNLVFRRKKKILERIPKNKLSISGISKWITQECKQSRLMSKFDTYYIPNIVDCEIFRPRNKILSRKKLKLPLEKKLVLFGAVGAKTDLRKGYHYLESCLNKIKRDDMVVVTFGGKKKSVEFINNITYYNFGFINDDKLLADLYSAADVMVVPSLQEAFGKTIAESMSCGTPVVAFNVGGPKDIVDHKINGYLVKFCDVVDLRIGILWVLNHTDPENLSINSRNKILANFHSDIVIDKYVDLYKRILKKFKSKF